jgi:hypothetical protein
MMRLIAPRVATCTAATRQGGKLPGGTLFGQHQPTDTAERGVGR